MKNIIKTAVIGVGNMGKNHARIFSQISKLIAVSDTDKNVGRAIAKKYDTRYYQDYRSMLKKEKLDAVSVAVPTKNHMRVAVECLSNKIPTLVEKPIADNVADARKILDEAKKYKTLLMVGHTERFNPAVVRLKEILRSNKLGTIVNLLAARIGIYPPRVAGLDVAVDLAIHDIDVINFLLGEFPKRKKAVKTQVFSYSKADSSSFILEYSKATAVIHANWITPVKIRKLFVSGTEGFAELDYIRQKLILYQKVMQLSKYGDYLDFLSLSDTPQKIEFVSKKEPLKEELTFFLDHYKDYRHTIQAEEAVKGLEVSL
ncbi:Gfo/Idh/MocA family oxidoreductase [Candidatus Roizmanbacteria bacterium]|nr:Gfo/Idh/MocA family oxidoreductase [Candidatus Roizmanbacteria bacterium]